MATTITEIPTFVLVGRMFKVGGTSDSPAVAVMREDDSTMPLGGAEVVDGKWSTKTCVAVDSGYPMRVYAQGLTLGGTVEKSKEHSVYAIGQFELLMLGVVVGVIAQKKFKVWKG